MSERQVRDELTPEPVAHLREQAGQAPAEYRPNPGVLWFDTGTAVFL